MSVKLKFREAYEVTSATKLDVDAGILRGVKVLGTVSRNGRRYTAKAIREAYDKKLYEGVPVYFDHPDGPENARKYAARFGRLKNVRLDNKGEKYADLHFNPKHSEAPSFCWYVENDPLGIGLSHNAEGMGTRGADGVMVVDEITKVYSADIVDGPATTVGLFEQQGATMDDVTTPATDPAAAPTPDAPADGGDFRAKLADLAQHVVSDETMSNDDILKQLKNIVAMLEDAGAQDGDPTTDDVPEDADDATAEKTMEQLGKHRSRAARWAHKIVGKVLRERATVKVREQAKKAGVPDRALTPVFLTQLVSAPVTLRESLIEDRKLTTAGGPRTTPRDTPIVTKPGDTEFNAAAIADTLFNNTDEY